MHRQQILGGNERVTETTMNEQLTNVSFVHEGENARILPPIQKLEAKLMKHEMKIVPRRPKAELKGLVVQHPISAEQR